MSYLGIGIFLCHAKGMLFFFKGKHARMSCHHHIDMFHTHFMQYCHKGCFIKRSMFYVLWMVYVVSLSVQVCDRSQVISLFKSVPLIPRLAKFWSFLSNLASSKFPELYTSHLQPSRFFPCLLKLHNAQRPHPPLESKTM